MRFGGLQRFTLADFPGRSAAVLFTVGCNLRCPYCHNPALATGIGADVVDPEAVWGFLEKRRRQLDGVVITGGEPTLQPDLADCCRRIKDLGYALKLDSNGLRPQVLRELLAARLLDYVALDVKHLPERYVDTMGAEAAAALRASIDLVVGSEVAHEVRTTVARPLHTIDDLARLGGELRAVDAWILQDYVPGAVLDPAFAAAADPWASGMKEELALRLATIEVYPRWRGEPERAVPQSARIAAQRVEV